MMTKKDRESPQSKTTSNVVKTTEELLADERMAKYMRKQKLLLKLVRTRIWKVFLGKKLFMQEDILKQQDELLNNLFGDRLDNVDSRYVDAMFLSYSKRQNKGKNPDNLCIKWFYASASKKLEKNNFDITNMHVSIDENIKAPDNERIFLSLPEYLNLLEQIRLEFKKWNKKYEKAAGDALKGSEDEEVFTDLQPQMTADRVRTKKIELCWKAYDEILQKSHIDADFSVLCHLLYLAFKASKHLNDIKKKLPHDEKLETSNIVIDDIFLKENFEEETVQQEISIDHLLILFEKLLEESHNAVRLRDMYDVS